MARKRTKTTRPPKRETYRDRYPGAKPVEGAGEWTEWKAHGQEIVGNFMGMERFRNGWKAEMDTDAGPVVFSVPSLLLGSLRRIEIGTALAIVYVGDRPGPAGKNDLKEFEVYALGTS
jgi:hypothetical protein